MSDANRWLYGFIAGALGLYGLWMEANDPGDLRNIGMVLFILAVVFIGWLIRDHYDGIDRQGGPHHPRN